MKNHLLRFLAEAGTTIIIVWIIGLFLFIQLIPFSPQVFPFPTDGMVVFTGGKTRIKKALSLFHQKKSKYLLISGVNPASSTQDILGRSHPDPSITLGYKALDTVGNADETAAWVKTKPIKTLRLVTSNYHMPRSLYELRHVLPDVKILPEPVIGENFLTCSWWKKPHVLSIIFYEYNKFLLSIVRIGGEKIIYCMLRWVCG